MTIPQHISIMRESLGPGFPDSGWMTGKQILALAMSRVIGTPYKRNEANAGIRDNLFNILLIQSGKRGINIDRQKARELINSIFFDKQSLVLFIPDGWDKKINELLKNHYCNKCGALLEIEHDEDECKNRILKEVMES